MFCVSKRYMTLSRVFDNSCTLSDKHTAYQLLLHSQTGLPLANRLLQTIMKQLTHKSYRTEQARAVYHQTQTPAESMWTVHRLYTGWWGRREGGLLPHIHNCYWLMRGSVG